MTCLPKLDLAFGFTSFITQGEFKHKLQQRGDLPPLPELSMKTARMYIISQILNETRTENRSQ